MQIGHMILVILLLFGNDKFKILRIHTYANIPRYFYFVHKKTFYSVARNKSHDIFFVLFGRKM